METKLSFLVGVVVVVVVEVFLFLFQLMLVVLVVMMLTKGFGNSFRNLNSENSNTNNNSNNNIIELYRQKSDSLCKFQIQFHKLNEQSNDSTSDPKSHTDGWTACSAPRSVA